MLRVTCWVGKPRACRISSLNKCKHYPVDGGGKSVLFQTEEEVSFQFVGAGRGEKLRGDCPFEDEGRSSLSQTVTAKTHSPGEIFATGVLEM